jgi:polyphosphate kinase 2 (PPK2 family)
VGLGPVVDGDVVDLVHLRAEIGELQARFLAGERRARCASSCRAFDGSGKDTGIADVMGALDPSGCGVYDFV